VHLQHFEAAGHDGHVLIEWGTAQELNNVGFDLYRTDAPDFHDPSMVHLGFVPAQHPGQVRDATYSYSDGEIQGGAPDTYYYWLEDVDFGGLSTRHGPVSVSRPAERPTSSLTFWASRVDVLEQM
jgi:hypothetical protein